MKKSLPILLGIIAIAILFAALTNPSEEHHRMLVKETVRDKINGFVSNTIKPKKAWQLLLAVRTGLGLQWMDKKNDQAISTEDFGIFSLTITIKNERKVVGVGAFGNVWLITDAINEVDYTEFLD